MLKVLNSHPRDKYISFTEDTHTYTVNGEGGYTSVTTLIHHYFPKFDADIIIQKMMNSPKWGPENEYYNMTPADIKKQWSDGGKESSKLGTYMHANIENYYNNLSVTEDFKKTLEYQYFINFVKDNSNLKPYRTEWLIYCRPYKIAGSIDMVFKDGDKYVLADWKRCKKIDYNNNFGEKGLGPFSDLDHCNYNHYCLQLNLYRILLQKYYNINIDNMFLVVLHPNNKNYIKIDVPFITKPLIELINNQVNKK
jgi:hypothetical protein